MLLLQKVLIDLERQCCTSTTRDYKTIVSRVENEGLSFLTITLATFGKDFRKSLDLGYVGPSHFAGFSRNGGLPRFMGGFLDHIFDRDSGRLLDEPDIACIHAINQLTLMWQKIKLPCSENRNRKALLDYVQCETDLKVSDSLGSSIDPLGLTRASAILWADVLSSVDKDVFEGNLFPAHGPGSTADHLDGNQKWYHRTWTRRLGEVFSIEDLVIPNHRYHEILDSFEISEPGAETAVTVILVPKTLKTPRVIAKEPTVMMFMQQALAASLTEHIEKNYFSRRVIGWQSSLPNQKAAQKGSLTGELATLDLSEASDRVSNQHVRALLANHPHLLMAVDACRSRKAVSLRENASFKLRLSKFASMGSALTFPIESMVFATICFMGIAKTLNRPLTHALVQEYMDQVRVYGDDIVIPVEFVSAVTTLLQDFGLKVNEDKSFWTGRFRESCGGEYYAGEDVTIVRLRHMLPTHRHDDPAIIATIAFRNLAYKAGLWATAAFVDDLLEGFKLPFPIVEPTSQGLGRHSVSFGYVAEKTCPDYQAPLVRALVIDATIPVNPVNDVAALMKCLSKLEGLSRGINASRNDHQGNSVEPSADEEHLNRSGRPRRVNTKPRWISPF